MVYDVVTRKELNVRQICQMLIKAIDEKNREMVDHYMELLIEEVSTLVVAME